MRQLKGTTAIFMAVMLGTGSISVSALADSDVSLIAEQSMVFSYEDLEDGTIKLTAYTGESENLFIPDSIDGKAVSEIGESCFAGDIHMKKIHVPEGVTAIDAYAFECCSMLEKAYLPESLIEIGDGAFSGCSQLILLDMQDNLEKIGKGAFLHCESLLTWYAPESLCEIGEFAFAGCTFLKQVEMKDSQVTKIPDRLFANCMNLNTVRLSYELTEVGKRAFYKCEALPSVYLSNTVTRVQSYAFEDCIALENADLNAEVIEEYTYKGCTNLSGLNISDNVKKIENNVFLGCYGLDPENLYIPEGVEVEEYAFGQLEEGDYSNNGINEEQDVVIPEGIIEKEELIAMAENLGMLTVPNDDFNAWAAEYVEFNADNAICSIEGNPYVALYKGVFGHFFDAMTAAASMDPTDLAAAEEAFGDDFLEMYQMIDHGLKTEIDRFRMNHDMILYTGVYDCQLRAAAGTEEVPTIEQLKACIGKTFKDPCLTSTTTDFDVTLGFSDTVFIIQASAESVNALGGVGIDAYMLGGEKEILLNSGAEYEILDAGIYHFEDTNWDDTKIDKVNQYVVLRLINQ